MNRHHLIISAAFPIHSGVGSRGNKGPESEHTACGPACLDPSSFWVLQSHSGHRGVCLSPSKLLPPSWQGLID